MPLISTRLTKNHNDTLTPAMVDYVDFHGLPFDMVYKPELSCPYPLQRHYVWQAVLQLQWTICRRLSGTALFFVIIGTNYLFSNFHSKLTYDTLKL